MENYYTKSEKREKRRQKEKYAPVNNKNVKRLNDHTNNVPKAVKKILESKIKVSKKWKK